VTGPVLLTIAKHRAHIVFADPPYQQEREYPALLDELSGDPPGLAILQHPVRLVLPESQGAFTRSRMIRQGDNALSFYATGM
jgi:16S rRNA (guanine966-N2)-methyltransferase